MHSMGISAITGTTSMSELPTSLPPDSSTWIRKTFINAFSRVATQRMQGGGGDPPTLTLTFASMEDMHNAQQCIAAAIACVKPG